MPQKQRATVEDLTRAQLERLPEDLRDSGLAAGVLVMAVELDERENSATSKAACFRALQDGLRELRELAPPEEAADGVDDITAQREKRLARLARAADSSRA